MANDALYVYGIVKSSSRNWEIEGIGREKVYTLSEGDYMVLVHNCQEKPYVTEDPNNIRELIIAHNKVLDRAIEDFGGVIPLPFNTIVKKGPNSALDNLRKWIDEKKENLEKKWCRIQGKKEYGIRVYYKKDEVVQEAVNNPEVQGIKENLKWESQGLSYLLQEKIKTKTNEIVQNTINQLKQKIHNKIRNIVNDAIANPSRILIDEKRDLLMSLSVLAHEPQKNEIKKMLEEETDVSFHFAGPFAPYSFV